MNRKKSDAILIDSALTRSSTPKSEDRQIVSESDPVSSKALDEFSAIVEIADKIASQSCSLDNNFSRQVMHSIELEQTAKRTYLANIANALQQRARPILVTAAAAIIILTISDYANRLPLQSTDLPPSPTPPYATAASDVDMIINSLSNIAKSMEGGIATLVVLVLLTIGTVLFAFTHRARVWIFRAIVAIASLSILAIAARLFLVQL